MAFDPDFPKGLKDIGTKISDSASNAMNKISSYVASDPAGIRLSASRLSAGGMPNNTKTVAPAKFAGTATDWRVKVALAKNADYFYKANNPGILAPLRNTDGVIFPYTPQISMAYTARYGVQQLTHSNYSSHTYEGSEVAAISITGDFTAQNGAEAAYVLACLHFFKSATKMWFGQGTNVGSPPPLLFLTGYGDNYFPNVPCVLTSMQHTMPADVDYIQANVSSLSQSGRAAAPLNAAHIESAAAASTHGQSSSSKNTTTMIPTSSQIQITLQPVYSRKNIKDNFNLTDFANGSLLGTDKSGGFI